MEQDGGLPEKRWSAADVKRLYEQHGPALIAYACSFLPNFAAAEDAVHSIFVRLLRGDVATPDSPAAYLYRSVKNTALNVKRNTSREMGFAAEGSWFVHQGHDREASIALQQALAELPEEQREVVVMRIWSGMTLDEIAVATGVSLNTVASRYRYALEKLRERLGPRVEEGVRDS